MQTVAFCEIDPFCQRVLKKHWPNVPIFPDIRTLTAADVPRVDLICGGFPCQDISFAGKGAGIEGERSGLWREFARLIGEIRPRFVIVENVAALLGRGLGRVLGDLAALGYDAEWHCIPASYVGAPHQRDRVWIVAYSQKFSDSCTSHNGISSQYFRSQGKFGGNNLRENFSNAYNSASTRQLANGWEVYSFSESIRFNRSNSSEWWASEPSVGRVAYGVPNIVERLGGYGNAVVPQIPEIIGRAILNASQTL